MILRLSQKLKTKIKAAILPALLLDENSYADWSAHLFVADRTQYVLLSNTKSLYSTVMLGRGVTDESQFIERALCSIRDFMEHDDQAFAYHQFIAPASESVRFARALNRQVTGCMSELVRHAQMLLIEEQLSLDEVGFKCNDLLLSAIPSRGSARYGTPRDAFKTMAKEIES